MVGRAPLGSGTSLNCDSGPPPTPAPTLGCPPHRLAVWPPQAFTSSLGLRRPTFAPQGTAGWSLASLLALCFFCEPLIAGDPRSWGFPLPLPPPTPFLYLISVTSPDFISKAETPGSSVEARTRMPASAQNPGPESPPIHHTLVVTMEGPRRSASSRPSGQSYLYCLGGLAFHRIREKISLVLPRKVDNKCILLKLDKQL